MFRSQQTPRLHFHFHPGNPLRILLIPSPVRKVNRNRSEKEIYQLIELRRMSIKILRDFCLSSDDLFYEQKYKYRKNNRNAGGDIQRIPADVRPLAGCTCGMPLADICAWL